ncbi:DUF642 domain-containing protein [Streptomyces sp. G5(2025)]|uniref:DUF642 domain-containing protein n=1 Tax=Streptomyces sp. G5(2025) TaxID=3406628 RepID=UPI003C140DDD
MRIPARTITVFAVAMLTALPLTQAQADPEAAPAVERPIGKNLVKNGSFDQPAVTREQRYKPVNSNNDSQISPWRVSTEGDLHIFSKQEAGHPDNLQAANITGNRKVTVEQSIPDTEQGRRYQLTWMERTETWEGCDRKPARNQSYEVAVTGTRTKYYTPTGKWLAPDPKTIDFEAEGDTKIAFISQSDDNVDPAHCGALITKVSLRELSSGTSSS